MSENDWNEQSAPKRIVFRFHLASSLSFGEPGSLGLVMSFPLLFSAPKQRAEAIGTRISGAIQLRHPIETTAHHAAATIGTLGGGNPRGS